MSYSLLLAQARALMQGENDYLANAANLSALLFQEISDLNWVGFYFLGKSELVLGPFQGKVACTRIPLGKGVCGTAARQGRSLLVPDVHAFEGHIACDTASASELVVPVMRGDCLLGVLDMDSPTPGRFTSAEQTMAEALVREYIQASNSVSFTPF